MKGAKSWIKSWLALAIAAALTVPAAYGEIEVVGSVTWIYLVEDGQATVTGATPTPGTLSIPSSLGGYPVTHIGYHAFRKKDVAVAIIPDSVTDLEEGAFGECSSLQAVSIGNNVTNIGEFAFYSCKTLSAVTFGQHVACIGNLAFQECYKLTTVKLPDSVTHIGTQAFYDCEGLKALTLGNGLEYIDDAAFAHCYNLTTVSIPSSVTYLGTNAFFQCFDLQTLYVSSSLREMVDQASPPASCTVVYILDKQKVTFDANGGSCSTTERYYPVEKAYGSFPTPTPPSYYAFDGWWTAATGGQRVLETDTVAVQEFRTLYAHWTLACQEVTFDASPYFWGEAGCYSIGQPYGSNPSLAFPTPSRKHYAFAGWWTSEEGGQQVLESDLPTMEQTRTLYAHWILTEQLMTFDANGGTCGTSNQLYTVGQAYASLPTPAKDGYAFAGWWTAVDGGQRVSESNIVSGTEYQTLYAHWAQQTVTFNANGGRCETSSDLYAIGKPYSSLPTAMREHYAFDGWWTASSGGVNITEKTLVETNATLTLYAHWTLTEQVVTFIANGGTCSTTNLTYAIGRPYGWLPTTTREDGVEFMGWHALTVNGNWERIDETSMVTMERSRELWAAWDGEDEAVHVSGFSRVGGTSGFTVEFVGTAGRTYALQRMQQLDGTVSWKTAKTLEATRTGSLSIAAETPLGWDKGFYRVVELGSGSGLPEPEYLVLDLSAGSGDDATYPVTCLLLEPQGGWTDEYKTTKLVLRRIEAGTFTMGSPTNELGRQNGYETQHEVTITKPFYMGVFEVTQKQWELVMGTNPSSYMGNMRPVEGVSYDSIRGSSAGVQWPQRTEVDATSFMGKLRARAGGFAFDLPTEAQWEYACRAGTTTALNSGKNLTGYYLCPNLSEVGRYRSTFYSGTWDGKGVYSSNHAVVGSYRPNAWGLYDMHGNVCEQCLDWWQDDLGSEPVTDPVGAASGSYRVKRGGDWWCDVQFCRSAWRHTVSPSITSPFLGFRLSMILPE